jgi:uncharacterized membrane protein YdbT with pleckstrin-like domain
MAYYTNVMQPGENLHILGRLHWIIYSKAIFFVCLAIAILIVYGAVNVSNVVDDAILFCIAAALLFAIFAGLAAFIQRHATEIVVTDRRVLFKTGLIWRRTIEMNISKVETVDVRQGITGRLLGFGTVIIRGTGASIEPLNRVTDPLSIRNAILTG